MEIQFWQLQKKILLINWILHLFISLILKYQLALNFQNSQGLQIVSQTVHIRKSSELSKEIEKREGSQVFETQGKKLDITAFWHFTIYQIWSVQQRVNFLKRIKAEWKDIEETLKFYDYVITKFKFLEYGQVVLLLSL